MGNKHSAVIVFEEACKRIQGMNVHKVVILLLTIFTSSENIDSYNNIFSYND